MTHTETVMAHLTNMLDGGAAPSMHSLEFAGLLVAIGSIDDGCPDNFHGIGTRVLTLLLARLKSSAFAEHQIKQMRDNSEPTC